MKYSVGVKQIQQAANYHERMTRLLSSLALLFLLLGSGQLAGYCLAAALACYVAWHLLGMRYRWLW